MSALFTDSETTALQSCRKLSMFSTSQNKHVFKSFLNQEQSHSYRRMFSEYKVSSHFFLKIEIKLSLLGMCKIFVCTPEQSGMT